MDSDRDKGYIKYSSFFSKRGVILHAHQLKDRHNINFCSFELKLSLQGIQLLNLNTPNKP
ncbi:hypothetical protein D0437_09455 [Bacillus cereus]|uniref:Uncharacterized protein n=1 Tax=Bacillus cereus TaxID=1396 RepID=A0A9X7M2Q2_BACCE|nr:hypothetical protein D0437_09455 [Bacillus cereus]